MADDFYPVPSSTTYTPLSPASKIIVEDVVTPLIPSRTTFTNIPMRTTFTDIPFRTTFTNIPTTTTTYSNIPFVTSVPVVPRVVTSIGVSTVYNPNSFYYYDSGIGENPLARHDTNVDLRYKFLDKWLVEDYQDILKMLRVEGNTVKVLSKSDAEKNDISKDSEKDVEKKADFIGYEILTLHKNGKILDALCEKNNLRYYDLPHNEYFVKKAQAKYVTSKLEEMTKK